MRYVSVCAGIEAATVAWHHMGWTPAWFSEIEPFPSAVLAHHYPEVRNLGDMTQYEEWPDEPVDLLVGGTPCQSFSVAGLRKGLSDPRGGLMLTYLEIARRYRPRWVVWENVPGVLSSNGGRDFGSFLGALGELGYGFAYRVLDAQWFGVAQRRRRVFVVGHLGDWRRAAAVLFERESVRRDTAPSRKARKDSTARTKDGAPGRWWDGSDVAATITTKSDDQRMPDKANAQLILQPITFGAQMSEPQTDVDLVQTMQATNPMAVAHALTARMYSKSSPDPGAGRGGPVVVAQPVAFEPGSIARNAGPSGESELAPTLRREMGDNQPAVRIDMQVRRLTPVECERLQGFPDNYTNIPWRKKDEAPDGPRYKALGNSMAVPVMRWIGERINAVEEAIE